MNDDVLLGRPLPKHLLFSEEPGVMAALNMPWPFFDPHGDITRGTWQWMYANTGLVLGHLFGRVPQTGSHSAYPLFKQLCNVTWALFRHELNATVQHRFRTYLPLGEGGDVIFHQLAQHAGVELGLQQVREVHWLNHAWQPKKDSETGEEVWDGGPEPDRLTHATVNSPGDKLPRGLFQWGSEHGVNFVNFNELQDSPPGGMQRLCSFLARVFQDSFDPAYASCMCATDVVGGTC